MTQQSLTVNDLLNRLPGSLHPIVVDMLMRGEPMEISQADRLLPLYVRRYYGTDVIDGESLRWEDKKQDGSVARIGRCYELAWVALTNSALAGTMVEGTNLVHGTIHGPDEGNVRMGHGWLEIPSPAGTIVWEPATAGLFDCAEWTRAVRARHERSYTVEQALILSLQNGDTGRWHESRYP